MEFLILRLSGVGVVGAIAMAFEASAFRSLFFAAIMGHYTVAAFASWANFRVVRGNPGAKWPLLSLAAIGLAYAAISPLDLTLLFGVHHALSEAGWETKEFRDSKKWEESAYSSVATFFHFFLFAYLLDLGGASEMLGFDPWGALALVASAGAALMLVRSEFPNRIRLIAGNAACLLIAFFLKSLVIRIHLDHIVFYHVVVWTIYPLLRREGGRLRFNSPLLVGNIAATAAFFLLTPSCGIFPGFDRGHNLRFAGNFGGIFHIMSSFAVSRWNPNWIRRFFWESDTALVTH